MRNAKDELIKMLEGTASIICAQIIHGYDWASEDRTVYQLVQNFTEADLASFLDSLDFQYDDGFGGQELYGTVWLADGTWFSRGEYDGSEWWEHNVCPEDSKGIKVMATKKKQKTYFINMESLNVKKWGAIYDTQYHPDYPDENLTEVRIVPITQKKKGTKKNG